jgi:hypothetical protein
VRVPVALVVRFLGRRRAIFVYTESIGGGRRWK